MRRWVSLSAGLLIFVIAVALATVVSPRSSQVDIVRIPEGGRMPQVATDHTGRLHLLYFEGAMSGGDLLYVTRALDADVWSPPQTVNSQPRSAVGVGPIDGGQMAIDSDGRLHVVWFQTNPVRIFYTRSTMDATQFEPQKTLVNLGAELAEAAPAVTVDDEGHVFVFWHAAAQSSLDPHTVDDAHRAVYMARSSDGGQRFEPPRPVSPLTEGACGCCNLRALADPGGTVVVSYRGARDNIQRGQRLLTSSDAGNTWSDTLIEPWELGACPVSTTAVAAAPTSPPRAMVAWETRGQIRFASTDRLDRAVTPEGEGLHRRKNPALAVNQRGDTLLVWGDGPGFRAGGTLEWQVFDAEGNPSGELDLRSDSIPSGSTPAAVARPDGRFVVLY